MTVKPEAKQFFTNIWKWIKRIVFSIMLLFLIKWCPYYKIDNDKDGIYILIDFLNIQKTIVLIDE